MSRIEALSLRGQGESLGAHGLCKEFKNHHQLTAHLQQLKSRRNRLTSDLDILDEKLILKRLVYRNCEVAAKRMPVNSPEKNRFENVKLEVSRLESQMRHMREELYELQGILNKHCVYELHRSV